MSFSITFLHKPIFSASIFLFLLASVCSVHSRQPGRRPADQGQWNSLNVTVEGRLVQGEPFAKTCFPVSGAVVEAFSSPACVVVRDNYLNETIRSNAPGGFINTQWETCQATSQDCLLDDSDSSNIAAVTPPRSCELGSVPDFFINTQKPGDVSAAFAFSRETGVPLVVKNTGHDYKGRSSAPGALALWTHNLKNISYYAEFVADGCSESQAAVTIGAGVQFRDIYAFAEKNNFTFVGGSDPGVGAAGGWVQGGGHGALSNTMGLGVDRILQYKVVTPDGLYRIANSCQNKDLFFALRGGGGGTFGVVLEATFIASPRVTLQVALVSFIEPNVTSTRDMWSIVVDQSLKWAEEGWGSFLTGESALFVTPTLNSTTAAASMQPLTDFGNKLTADNVPNVTVLFQEFPSWGSFFNTFANTDSAAIGANLAIASRLIPKENFETADSREELLDALLNAHSQTPGLRLLGSTPFNFAGDNTTSVTEAWRNSVYHVTLIATWNFNATLNEKSSQYDIASSSIDNLRKITPSAAYSNEADVHEPNHEIAFWGTHYDELLRIKQKYDPDGLLDCWQCVGWKPSSNQFSCYI